ncbi:DUF6119 family protein [Nocardia gamkensis]
MPNTRTARATSVSRGSGNWSLCSLPLPSPRASIYTEAHPPGIGVCNILAPDGTLVHVKNLERSAPASHLLVQALVSAEALLNDQEAREKFAELVAKRGGGGVIPTRVEKVVLGMSRKGCPIAVTDLFTFRQVLLVRGVSVLRQRHVGWNRDAASM